jgi:ribosomal protein S18 acetylase RimI-like enzyme
MEEVDAVNREFELNYLTKVFAQGISNDLCIFVIRDNLDQKIYRYIGVKIIDNNGYICGLYVQSLVRGLGLGKKLMDAVIFYVKSKQHSS